MSDQVANEPWYKDGLRFCCTQCGNCCTGPPGYVWVNGKEMEQIAAYLGDGVARLRSEFVREVGVRYSLRERANGDCVFLDANTRRCTIYAVRPRQCRSWPFWPSNLRSPQDWQQTCEFCPGAGQGEMVPLEQIETQAALIRV